VLALGAWMVLHLLCNPKMTTNTPFPLSCVGARPPWLRNGWMICWTAKVKEARKERRKGHELVECTVNTARMGQYGPSNTPI
jgi:hypothetical protein